VGKLLELSIVGEVPSNIAIQSLTQRIHAGRCQFDRLSGQAAGFANVLVRQCSPPLSPLLHPTPADHGCGRRVGRIDRQRLPGEGDRLVSALFGKAICSAA